MTSLYMYDDVTASLLPQTAEYVAYYTDGTYANAPAVKARCPRAKLVSIAVTSMDKADVLDVESGDAQIPDIYYWLHMGQKPVTTRLPVIYTSVANVNRMMLTMNANKFVHGHDYLIWSAHYTGTAHVCGPKTCGATFTDCDATQFTNHAMNQSLDESLCNPDFFAVPPAPKPPVPKPEQITLDIGGAKVVLEKGQTYRLTVS